MKDCDPPEANILIDPVSSSPHETCLSVLNVAVNSDGNIQLVNIYFKKIILKNIPVVWSISCWMVEEIQPLLSITAIEYSPGARFKCVLAETKFGSPSAYK